VSARVLVTGGASGLGRALAARFRDRGDQVLVGDLAQERPPDLPDGTDYLRLDVTDQGDWDRARVWVDQHWGGLDILVNNAGVATGGRIDVESLEDWRRVVDINLLGVVRGCRTFTPMLKRQRSGHIVNIASLAGLVHGPGMASYNAVKAGVVALSETLSFELEPWGVVTSVVCPAFFRTNLHSSLRGTDVVMERTAERLITGAIASADDIAPVVLKGVDAHRHLILTDSLGRRAYWAKRLARPVYDRFFRAGAALLARRGDVQPEKGDA
jgi:NAD(P)-dependent dehydrogenase (short-subunit alcohol dehydrogenase family)